VLVVRGIRRPTWETRVTKPLNKFFKKKSKEKRERKKRLKHIQVLV
jgi:hypothetical protein